MTSSHPSSRAAALAAALCVAGTAAFAHTEAAPASGLLSGFLHPWAGFDHLLAMVAVGIWGAFLGPPLLWALPIVFPLLMVVGGVLGILGVPMPAVELGIAMSVLLLGAVIAIAWKAPRAAALVLVALFGILHGHAHGTELPQAASPVAYSTGFVLSTGLLHLGGIALGLLDRLPRGPYVLRGIGGAMAAAGLWMLVARLG